MRGIQEIEVRDAVAGGAGGGGRSPDPDKQASTIEKQLNSLQLTIDELTDQVEIWKRVCMQF